LLFFSKTSQSKLDEVAATLLAICGRFFPENAHYILTTVTNSALSSHIKSQKYKDLIKHFRSNDFYG